MIARRAKIGVDIQAGVKLIHDHIQVVVGALQMGIRCVLTDGDKRQHDESTSPRIASLPDGSGATVSLLFPVLLGEITDLAAHGSQQKDQERNPARVPLTLST